MTSYRIRFVILCSACGQPDKWDIPGMGESHAQWINRIRTEGETHWRCSLCRQTSLSKVVQAVHEEERNKR